MAGLDVHRASISATVLIARDPEEPIVHSKDFSALQPGLLELRDWLLSLNCGTVAMESSCIYWKAPFKVLEDAGCTPFVLNPYDVKAKRGKKSDHSDAFRIAHLSMHGIVLPSFVPSPPIRELRLLTRGRTVLLNSLRKIKNQISLTLDEANFKFSVIATDLFGATGREIMNIIAADPNPNPRVLANQAKGVLRNKIDELVPALSGQLTAVQRFLLKNRLKELKQIEDHLQSIEIEIESFIAKNQLESFLAPLLSIPGIKRVAATTILAEIGTSVIETFPSPQQFASWAGLCPGMNESAGKRRKSSICKANRYLKSMLVQVAWCALRAKNSPFRPFFQSVKARRGANRALIAVAHKMLRIIYALYKYNTVFSPAALIKTETSASPGDQQHTDLSPDFIKSLTQNEQDLALQEVVALSTHDALTSYPLAPSVNMEVKKPKVVRTTSRKKTSELSSVPINSLQSDAAPVKKRGKPRKNPMNLISTDT